MKMSVFDSSSYLAAPVKLPSGVHRYAGDPKFMKLRLVLTDHNSLIARPNLIVSREDDEQKDGSKSGNELKQQQHHPRDKSNLFQSSFLLRQKRQGRWTIRPEEIEKSSWLNSSGLRLKVVSGPALGFGLGKSEATNRPQLEQTNGADANQEDDEEDGNSNNNDQRCECCGYFFNDDPTSRRNGDVESKLAPALTERRGTFDWRNSTQTTGSSATIMTSNNATAFSQSTTSYNNDCNEQRTQARKLNLLIPSGELDRQQIDSNLEARKANLAGLCIAHYQQSHSSSCYNSPLSPRHQSLVGGDKNLITSIVGCRRCCNGKDDYNYQSHNLNKSSGRLSCHDDNAKAKIAGDTRAHRRRCCCWCELTREYRAWLTEEGRDLTELEKRYKLRRARPVSSTLPIDKEVSGENPKKTQGADSAARIMSSLSTSSLSVTMAASGDLQRQQMITLDAINSNRVIDDGDNGSNRVNNNRPTDNLMGASGSELELVPEPRNDTNLRNGKDKDHDSDANAGSNGQCKTSASATAKTGTDTIRSNRRRSIRNRNEDEDSDRIITLQDNAAGAAAASGTGCRFIEGEILFIVMEKYANPGESFTKFNGEDEVRASTPFSSSESSSRSESPSDRQTGKLENATATSRLAGRKVFNEPQVVATDEPLPQFNHRKSSLENDHINRDNDDNYNCNDVDGGKDKVQQPPKLSHRELGDSVESPSVLSSSESLPPARAADGAKIKTRNVMIGGADDDDTDGNVATRKQTSSKVDESSSRFLRQQPRGVQLRGEKVAEFCVAVIVIDRLHRRVQLTPDLNQLVNMSEVFGRLNSSMPNDPEQKPLQMSSGGRDINRDISSQNLQQLSEVARSSSSWSLASRSDGEAASQSPEFTCNSAAPSSHQLYYRIELPVQVNSPLVSLATSALTNSATCSRSSGSELASIRAAERELNLLRKFLRNALDGNSAGSMKNTANVTTATNTMNPVAGFLSPMNGSVLVNLQLDIHFASEFPANCRNLYVNYKVMARNERNSSWRLKRLKPSVARRSDESALAGHYSHIRRRWPCSNGDDEDDYHYDADNDCGSSNLLATTKETSLRSTKPRQSFDDSGMSLSSSKAAVAMATSSTTTKTHGMQQAASSMLLSSQSSWSLAAATAEARSVDSSINSGDVIGKTNGDSHIVLRVNGPLGEKLEQASRSETMSHASSLKEKRRQQQPQQQQMTAATSSTSSVPGATLPAKVRFVELDIDGLANRKSPADGTFEDQLDGEFEVLHEGFTVTSWPDTRGKFNFSCLEQLTLEMRQVVGQGKAAGRREPDFESSSQQPQRQTARQQPGYKVNDGDKISGDDKRGQSKAIIETIRNGDGDSAARLTKSLMNVDESSGGKSSVNNNDNNKRNLVSITRGSESVDPVAAIDFSQKVAKSASLRQRLADGATSDEIYLDTGQDGDDNGATELTRFGQLNGDRSYNLEQRRQHPQQVVERKKEGASEVAEELAKATATTTTTTTSETIATKATSSGSDDDDDDGFRGKGLAHKQELIMTPAEKMKKREITNRKTKTKTMTTPTNSTERDPGTDSAEPFVSGSSSGGAPSGDSCPCELILLFEFYSRDFFLDKPQGFAHFHIPVSPLRIKEENDRLLKQALQKRIHVECKSCATNLRTRSWRLRGRHNGISRSASCKGASNGRCKCTTDNNGYGSRSGSNPTRLVHEIPVIRPELQTPMDKLRYHLIGQLPKSAPNLESVSRSLHNTCLREYLYLLRRLLPSVLSMLSLLPSNRVHGPSVWRQSS